MNEQAVAMVQKYIDEHLFEPQSNLPKEEFNKRSHSIWAANEIITRLMDNPFEDPEIIIEGFILDMVMFSHMEEMSDQHAMFSIATNTAMDILHLITKGEDSDGQI